jgi:hypothetical protein
LEYDAVPGTVTIACKLPNGLILRVFKLEKSQEATPLGQHDIDIARDTGKRITIAGNAAPHGKSPLAPISGGYALTHNVDADTWEQWLAANINSDLVRNKMIFAHAKQNELDAEARANETRLSGLERLDTQGDKRMPTQRTQLSAGAINPLETAVRG